MTDATIRAMPIPPRPATAMTANVRQQSLREIEVAVATQRQSEDVRIDELGRMSAEAVLSQYEAAARKVEEMGDDVKKRISDLEAALHECDDDLKLIGEAAAAIREKGKHVQVQIEEASALSRDIRTACEEFKKKIGA